MKDGKIFYEGPEGSEPRSRRLHHAGDGWVGNRRHSIVRDDEPCGTARHHACGAHRWQ